MNYRIPYQLHQTGYAALSAPRGPLGVHRESADRRDGSTSGPTPGSIGLNDQGDPKNINKVTR